MLYIKGIRGHVVKIHITFKVHLDCLFTNDVGDKVFNPHRENIFKYGIV